MEKLKYTPEKSFIPSIEEVAGEITKEGFKKYWKDPRFAEGFPNMVYLFTSPEVSDKFTHEQKQRIFELGLKSLMELPWIGGAGGAAVSGKMLGVNEQTQLWEKVDIREIKPGIEALTRLEIGSLILLGLSLKNKQHSKKFIVDCYKNLKDTNKTTSKSRSLRGHILNNLLTVNSPFREWVKTNNLDANNGFEWDREVSKLGLMLLPLGKATAPVQEVPNNLPPEFKDLKNFPPLVIDEFVNYALRMPIIRLRSDFVLFINELNIKLQSNSFKDDLAFKNNPLLYGALQKKTDRLRMAILA